MKAAVRHLGFLPVRRYDSEAISRHRVSLSVCLCVCLFVTRRYCIKTAKRRITQTTSRDSPTLRVVGEWPPLPPKICLQIDPPLFRAQQFRPISAHSTSTVRAGEKVRLALIGSRLRAFQRAIDEPCTLQLSPPKGGTKHDFAVFAGKIQLLSKKSLLRSFFVWKLPTAML